MMQTQARVAQSNTLGGETRRGLSVSNGVSVLEPRRVRKAQVYHTLLTISSLRGLSGGCVVEVKGH